MRISDSSARVTASSVWAVEDDPFNLNRFVEAQSPIYAEVVDELRSGRKRSHWMWFIFPQFQGLGLSDMARRYAIMSVEEAHKYLSHPILGPRVIECTRLVNDCGVRDAHEIFGTPDDLKFHSSMTLFSCAAGPNSEFASALERFFSGEPDIHTCELMRDISRR